MNMCFTVYVVFRIFGFPDILAATLVSVPTKRSHAGNLDAPRRFQVFG